MNAEPKFEQVDSRPSRKLTTAAKWAFAGLVVAGMNWDVSTEIKRDRYNNPVGMRVNRPVYFGDEIFYSYPKSARTQIGSEVRFPPNVVPPWLIVDFDRQEHRLDTDLGPDVLATFNFFSPATKGEYVVRITEAALLKGLDPELARKHKRTVEDALAGRPALLPHTKEWEYELP